MTKQNEWIDFFKGEARQYHTEIFTKNTKAEVDFLIEAFNLPEGSALLDLGCGIGRHTIPLAEKGFKMTGLDISADMLEIAKANANKTGVDIHWIEMDAKNFSAEPQFDAAICLCEGALCLLGSEDDPFERDIQVLKNIFNALKPGARLIVNVLSAFRVIREIKQEDIKSGRFDPLTMTELGEMEFEIDGRKQKVITRERYYTPTEFRLILKAAGFEVEELWGGEAGSWNKQPVRLEEFELMAVARKP
ncbi:MAG: methyltransferase domain-containing protein [Anaerolineaceae bacterium]|nr:methyltransferase domain-containing protein [Anaerolineaceae bacterium]